MSVSHNELDANFEHFWFGVLPMLLNMVDLYNGQHCGHENLLAPSNLHDLF